MNESAADNLEGRSILQKLLGFEPENRRLRGKWAASAVELANAYRVGKKGFDEQELLRAVGILESLPEPVVNDLMTLAKGHALLVGVSGEHADRAMLALRRAVNLGFRDVEFLTSEKALDALRDRIDFHRLVDDVAFPSEPEKIFAR